MLLTDISDRDVRALDVGTVVLAQSRAGWEITMKSARGPRSRGWVGSEPVRPRLIRASAWSAELDDGPVIHVLEDSGLFRKVSGFDDVTNYLDMPAPPAEDHPPVIWWTVEAGSPSAGRTIAILPNRTDEHWRTLGCGVSRSDGVVPMWTALVGDPTPLLPAPLHMIVPHRWQTHSED